MTSGQAGRDVVGRYGQVIHMEPRQGARRLVMTALGTAGVLAMLALSCGLYMAGCQPGPVLSSPSQEFGQPPAPPQPVWTSTSSVAHKQVVSVPDVVCHVLQNAQDELQAAGFRRLASEDGTGLERIQLWDRSWTVVRQSPPPGSSNDIDTTVVLTAVRNDEAGAYGCRP